MYSVGKRILAAILVLCLMQPVLPVWAEEENTEESTVPETTEAPEVTEIAEEPEETEIPEETENSGETEEPTETETPEETETTEEPDAGPSIPPVRAVAEVLALEVGTENIRMEGVVVFAAGYQAILQDDTGGIRLAFSAKPGLAPGDLVTVAGRRSGGFLVEDFTKTGEGPMPAVESGLDEDRSDLRILVRNAVLDQGCLTQMGYTYALAGQLPESVKNGDRVDAWGVLLDGIFYADTILPAARTPEEEMPSGMEDWNFYFGQLHAHSEISDGTGTAEEAFAHAYGAEHLDFFALTDHSNSFDNAEAGSVNQDGTAISTE